MPDLPNSRDAPRGRKRGGAERFRKAAPVVEEAVSADSETAESDIATPPQQPHRPWLVPGIGKL
jgi:hypothetical protein